MDKIAMELLKIAKSLTAVYQGDDEFKTALKKEPNEVIPKVFLFQIVQQPETPVSWFTEGFKFTGSL